MQSTINLKNNEPVQWGKVALCYRRPKVAALFGVAAAEGDKHEIILSAILKVMLCAGIYIYRLSPFFK